MSIRWSLFRKGGGIGKRTSLVVVGDAITFASAIVSSMILARIIPMEVMGTYRQVMYLLPLVVTCSGFGLSGTVYRFWNALDNQKQACYARMMFALSLLLGMVGCIVLATLAHFVSVWYGNPDLKMTLQVVVLFPLAIMPYGLLRPILLSWGYSIHATLMETMFSLISVLSLIVPLWMGFGLVFALRVWILISFLRLLIVPFILKDYLRRGGPWWNVKLFRQVWDYLWPIQLARLPGYLSAYFDKVVMSLFLNAQQFAVYSLGAREVPFIGKIAYSVGSVLIPSLVQDAEAQRYEQIRRRWALACERTAMSTYLIAAFCIWHAVPVIQFLFSTTYRDSSVPFRIFAALTFLRVVDYGSLAKAFGRSDVIMKSAFVGSGAMIIVSVPLTWGLGPMGMALTVLLANMSSAGYFLNQYRKLLQSPVKGFFPWPRLFFLLGISVTSTAACAWLSAPWVAIGADTSFFTLGWQLSVLFTFSALIYTSLLTLFGFMNPLAKVTLIVGKIKWSNKSS